LHDDVTELDKTLRPSKHSQAVRRYVPGYFRPCVLLTDSRDIFNPRYNRVDLLDRTPSLFLVSKQVAVEAREVALRHVLVEVDRDKCLALLQKWAKDTNCPMLRNMRSLFVCTLAEVPKPLTWKAPLAFATGWPRLYFNYRHVPLFRIEIDTDGTMLTLYAQRCLVQTEKTRLMKAINLWFQSLGADHRFSNRDLLAVATIIRGVQVESRYNSWTLQLDQQDIVAQKVEAEDIDAEERRSGNRSWSKGYLGLESQFRATVFRLSAPFLRNSVESESTASVGNGC
jgi:hypothetical protein